MLIKKVFHLTPKENIDETKEAITPIIDAVKLWFKMFHWEVTDKV